jgi:hypothetical protein
MNEKTDRQTKRKIIEEKLTRKKLIFSKTKDDLHFFYFYFGIIKITSLIAN